MKISDYCAKNNINLNTELKDAIIYALNHNTNSYVLRRASLANSAYIIEFLDVDEQNLSAIFKLAFKYLKNIVFI